MAQGNEYFFLFYILQRLKICDIRKSVSIFMKLNKCRRANTVIPKKEKKINESRYSYCDQRTIFALSINDLPFK